MRAADFFGWALLMGSFILWVEMPEQIDSIILFHLALEQGIGISPGSLFTLTENRYRNFIRLSTATWDETIEQGVKKLGELANQLMRG